VVFTSDKPIRKLWISRVFIRLLYIPEVKMDSQENRIIQLEMPDLSSLSETERLQVIAVMQRAQVTLQSTQN
jgi:hypothetical protein